MACLRDITRTANCSLAIITRRASWMACMRNITRTANCALSIITRRASGRDRLRNFKGRPTSQLRRFLPDFKRKIRGELMVILEMTIHEGRTYNHPFESYSNFRQGSLDLNAL